MLKKDLIKRIKELEKENQELRVKHQNEVSATFALTTAMQMIMANQVGNFIKPKEEEKEEEIIVTSFPDDKKYKVDQVLEVGEIGILEGKLVKCLGNDDEIGDPCEGCCFDGAQPCPLVNCTNKIFIEVKDEEN